MSQEISIISAAISIFWIFNAIGQTAVFISTLSPYPENRQKKIIIREVTIALIILLFFAFFGTEFLSILGLTQGIVGIAGGLLLVIIALNMIFPKPKVELKPPSHEPMIVPLAIPGLAGPGSIAVVMLFSSQLGPLKASLATILAWIPSFIILYLAPYIKKILGDKGMQAFERLGGMLLCLFGIQMIASGIIHLIKANF